MQRHGLNEAVRHGDLEISVRSVQIDRVVRTSGYGGRGKTVGFEVVVRNVGPSSTSVNAINFSLTDSTSRQYGSYSAVSLDPELPSGEIGPGEAVRGWVQFEVPANAEGFVLAHEAFLSGDVACWDSGY